MMTPVSDTRIGLIVAILINVQSCREAELRIESAGGHIEHANDRQQLYRNI
jgi:hypothetical protein